jgi:hypothetical protein
MKDKKIVKKTAPLPSKPAAVKGHATSVHDLPTQDATVDAQPASDTPTAVSVTEHAKPAKPARKATSPDKVAKPAKPAKPAKVAKKPLNFKVPADFRREFKTYASKHDLKLNGLLELAFESYRKQPGY